MWSLYDPTPFSQFKGQMPHSDNCQTYPGKALSSENAQSSSNGLPSGRQSHSPYKVCY